MLHAQDVFRPDLRLEAERVLGTTDPDHPGVRHLREATRPWLVGDVVEGVRLPTHYDFRHLRHTPAELRTVFASRGCRRVVAFQTRNPMHRAHLELTLRAATQAGAKLLVHPVVGATMPGDVDTTPRSAATRRSCRAIQRAWPCCRCCRWPCAWPGRARPCGMPSSGRTMASAT